MTIFIRQGFRNPEKETELSFVIPPKINTQKFTGRNTVVKILVPEVVHSCSYSYGLDQPESLRQGPVKPNFQAELIKSFSHSFMMIDGFSRLNCKRQIN